MPPRDTQTRNALSRAQWAILQTGLITSGLALFGVYVLGCRDNKFFIMHWSARRWIFLGPLIVGGICASGYLIGAYWSGLRIRGWLFVTVLLLQLISFTAAHYAEYATALPIWSASREPPSFTDYARFVALHMSGDYDHPHPPQQLALASTGLQIFQFCLGALLSPLMLARKPRCRFCGGTLHQRMIGSITTPGDIPRLTHFATLGDAAPLQSLLQPKDLPIPDELAVQLTRCVVCHQGQLLPPAKLSPPIDVSRKLVQLLWTPAATS